MMTRLRNFQSYLYDTRCGVLVVWWIVAAVTLTTFRLVGPYIWLDWLAYTVLGAQAFGAVVFLSVPVVDLCKRRWGRSAAHFILALVSLSAYFAALLYVVLCLDELQAHRDGSKKTEQPWCVSAVCDEVPFSIGFSPSHPFLAEYKRKVVFRSGKEFALCADTGGGGDFHVYGDGSKVFYIADERRGECQARYGVDVEHEKVMPIEDLPVVIRNDKRHIGYVTTEGEFVPGEKEPADWRN